MGFFVVCYLGGPFVQFFVPMYTFIAGCTRSSGIYVFCVVGEGAEAEVFLSIVQAIMVDVVDDEVVGGVCYLAVHFYGFPILFSGGVESVVRGFGEPCELG